MATTLRPRCLSVHPRPLPNGSRPQVRGGPARIDDHTGGSLAGKLSREASSTASGNSRRRSPCATTSLEGESGGRPATSDRSWFVTTVSPCRPDARSHRSVRPEWTRLLLQATSRGRAVAFDIPELFLPTRVPPSMRPLSISPLCVHQVHVDSTSGRGRAMASRPVGSCPPERLERGWSANRGARLTRVSANRLPPAGRAADVRRARTSAPTATRPRGMGGRGRRLTA